MSFPPEIYLIGAQKSGTTTLAYLLSQHPQLCVAKSKEPNFFTARWNKGLGWYKEEFPHFQEKICIDASTSYSFAPLSKENSMYNKNHFHNVPKRIHSLNPNAKFIYLLRDPVERTYSSYWHSFNMGRETKSFGEAIRNDYFYLDVSNYYGQLTLWLDYFPAESILLLLFKDLKSDLEQTLKKCFRFIGVDENVLVSLDRTRNKTVYFNRVGRQCNRIFKKLDHSGLHYLAPSIVRNFVRGLTSDPRRKIPAILDDDKSFLCKYFFDKNRSLELLTGLNLNHWQA